MTHNFIGTEKHKTMIDSGTTHEDEPEDVRTVSGTTPEDVTISGTTPLDVKTVYRTTQEDERTVSGTVHRP